MASSGKVNSMVFNDENISSYEENIDCVRDLYTLQQELMLYDLNTCEKAIYNMESIIIQKKEGIEMRIEYDSLYKIWEVLTGFPRNRYISANMKEKEII